MYDLVNFYNNLKVKFSKSSANEILTFMIYELKSAINLKDTDAIIFIGNELGSYLRVMAEIKSSYKIYETIKYLTLKKYGCNSKEYATILLNLADVDIVDKNYTKAIERLNRSEEILKDLNEKYLMATMYNNRSSAYRGLNNYKSARRDIENAIRLIDNRDKIAISRINLAEVKLLEGNFLEALNDIRKVIEYYSNENPRDIHFANALSTAANIFYKLRDYDRSIEFYKLAYTKFHDKFGNCEMTKLLQRNIEKVKIERNKY
ncbi:tetratricopeptide repeat protein [Peptoniphilus sp. AGMB00490]|uniref:Tetratricopeptide repeat protein n=1 Tax=Peptoniphilus faecalis TaxID=2731255 RepID=A0A848RH31_9FIRM|nr:tetratricopeptide repeat protein [Peptoniphilus faecalis]NMW85315.1 tetratricopeptide repeat protein [Peptoniphilus faecalis]